MGQLSLISISVARGEPDEFLCMLHFIFLDFSPLITENNLQHNYDLYQKKTGKFLEECYKICNNIFSVKPPLTQAQFFSNGYAERKALFVSDVIQKVKTLHILLKKRKQDENRPKWTGLSSVRPLYPGLTHSPEELVPPNTKVERVARKKGGVCKSKENLNNLVPSDEKDWYVQAAIARGIDTQTQGFFQKGINFETSPCVVEQAQFDKFHQEKTVELPHPQYDPPIPLAQYSPAQTNMKNCGSQLCYNSGEKFATMARRLDEMDKKIDEMISNLLITVSTKFDNFERRINSIEARQSNLEKKCENSHFVREVSHSFLPQSTFSNKNVGSEYIQSKWDTGLDDDELSFVVLGRANRANDSIYGLRE
jgi:hypothetical protein